MMTAGEIADILTADDFGDYYGEADRVREENFGDIVDIRAILECSNICARKCRYCGLNACNSSLERYRMPAEDIVATARKAAEAGYRTLVLQSGEDRGRPIEETGDIVASIAETGLTVTLSLGEMSRDEMAYLKARGASRYLLKHETANPSLYAELHPDGSLGERLENLATLRECGYEVGSGFMVGLPEQTAADIAHDILTISDLRCEMCGIGTFIPHPDTPLAGARAGSAELTRRALAITRILNPRCNLPATTSLEVSGDGMTAFSAGANVIMNKVTPTRERALYEIYPSAKRETDIFGERKELEKKIRALGRTPR